MDAGFRSAVEHPRVREHACVADDAAPPHGAQRIEQRDGPHRLRTLLPILALHARSSSRPPSRAVKRHEPWRECSGARTCCRAITLQRSGRPDSNGRVQLRKVTGLPTQTSHYHGTRPDGAQTTHPQNAQAGLKSGLGGPSVDPRAGVGEEAHRNPATRSPPRRARHLDLVAGPVLQSLPSRPRPTHPGRRSRRFARATRRARGLAATRTLRQGAVNEGRHQGTPPQQRESGDAEPFSWRTICPSLYSRSGTKGPVPGRA